MLRVIRNHRRAAYDVAQSRLRKTLGDYESLDIQPVGIDASQFTDTDPLASPPLLQAARECWDRALASANSTATATPRPPSSPPPAPSAC